MCIRDSLRRSESWVYQQSRLDPIQAKSWKLQYCERRTRQSIQFQKRTNRHPPPVYKRGGGRKERFDRSRMERQTAQESFSEIPEWQRHVENSNRSPKSTVCRNGKCSISQFRNEAVPEVRRQALPRNVQQLHSSLLTRWQILQFNKKNPWRDWKTMYQRMEHHCQSRCKYAIDAVSYTHLTLPTKA